MSVENNSFVLHAPTLSSALPPNWGWARLGDVCEGIFDCPHSTPQLSQYGPLLARSQDIRTGFFRVEQAARVSEETYKDRIARAEPKYGDLLFSREGTYFGIAAEVPTSTKVCLGQRMVLIRPKQKQLDFRYLRYWINSPLMISHIQSLRDGTVAERLNLPTIRNLPILLPPIEEQRAIAHILAAFDDKIELNRRMNVTLEEVAHTLFKSWFVDFDPVKEKIVGHEPEGIEAETAILFPSEFQESELGAIPKGWKAQRINELAELNGWTLRNSDKISRIEYIEISAVNKGNISEVVEYERGCEPSRARRRLRHGDTVLSTVRPERGAYFLCLHPSENLIASTGFAVISPREDNWAFIHAALTRKEIFETLGRLADGGVYPAVRPEIIGDILLAVPNESRIVKSFHDVVAPLYKKAEANRIESRSLSKLRDTLLPKLISGQIPILTSNEPKEVFDERP